MKACPNDVAAADCLTTTSRAALARIYAPIVGPSGEIYPGQPVGGEADRGGWQVVDHRRGPAHAGGQRRKGAELRASRFGTEFFKYFVFGDPAWDYTAV